MKSIDRKWKSWTSKQGYENRKPRLQKEEKVQSDGNGKEVPIGKAVGMVPKMPYFDEERDCTESYLGRFERFAETQK